MVAGTVSTAEWQEGSDTMLPLCSPASLPFSTSYGLSYALLAGRQAGHTICSPVREFIGKTRWSLGMRSGSSEARYVSIAVKTTLFLTSSNTILSKVSRWVCQVYR